MIKSLTSRCGSRWIYWNEEGRISIQGWQNGCENFQIPLKRCWRMIKWTVAFSWSGLSKLKVMLLSENLIDKICFLWLGLATFYLRCEGFAWRFFYAKSLATSFLNILCFQWNVTKVFCIVYFNKNTSIWVEESI